MTLLASIFAFLGRLWQTFFARKPPKPAENDVAIAVRSGSAVILTDGAPVYILDRETVLTMGVAIDDRRAALRSRLDSAPPAGVDLMSLPMLVDKADGSDADRVAA